MINILLTSVGRRGYLIKYFKEALKDKGCVFATNSIYTSALSEADYYEISPLIYSQNYIEFLLEFVKRHKINAVIPLFDIDARILAKNRDKLKENGAIVITGSSETLEICNDKWRMFNVLSENKINTVKTFLNSADCIAAIKEGSLLYPIIVKPRWGMGSIGIYTADNEEELLVFEKKLKREIFNTYLKYESVQEKDQSVIFQEKIDANEFGLDIINDLNCNYVTTVAKRKLSMRAGETDSAVIVPMPELEQTGKTLSELMKHAGNLDVDCFVSENGVYVLEMNCRFGGQYPFSHIAGVNLPLQIVKWLAGESTDFSLFNPEAYSIACKDLIPRKISLHTEKLHDFQIKVNSVLPEELLAFYQECDHYFKPILSQRSDLKLLADKHCKFGITAEAWYNGNICGIVVLYANDYVTNTAYIPVVAIHDNFRKKQLGTTLVNKAVTLAKLYGMKKINLKTEYPYYKTLGLYAVCGCCESDKEDEDVIIINL